MGKTRDLFKKTGDTKETFHAKMGTIKDRNDNDITKAEESNKRRQEYTEKLYKKVVLTQITMTVVTQSRESLTSWECEVKRALGSITMKKATGGDEISAELLQILKEDTVKVLHSICQQIWKTQQGPQDRKRSVFIPNPKKRNAKECSNYRTTALISQASKMNLKILQARLQQYVNQELPGI